MSNDVTVVPDQIQTLLTLPQAARSLNISVRHIQNLINVGKLESIHLGGSHRVLVSDLHAFIARLKSERQARGLKTVAA
jgi:excisionase family DNA binding protein